MYLSKSKFCNGVQCKKMLWLEENKPEEKTKVTSQSVLDNGTEVGIVAGNLFGNYIRIEYDDELNQMVLATKRALTKEEIVIAEASFCYNNNFCSVDFLKKKDGFFELYEVKSSTDIKDIYLDDIAYQNYVISSLGYSVAKNFIVYINGNYVKRGNLDYFQLFKIKDVTEIVKAKSANIKTIISNINEYMKQEEPRDAIGLHCMTPYECPFFQYCTRHLPTPNIFDIRNMSNKNKFKFYHNGIYSYEDLLKQDISWKYKQQIDYELNDLKDHINYDAIKAFLDTLSYPLYFLDFETYQQAIPQYDGIKPYTQIPFQYSLHYIEQKDGKLHHKEFLARHGFDPRRELAEHLIEDIPSNACILAYNMSFEKSVIKNLSLMYKEYSVQLMALYDHIKDLMAPFYNRDYYTKEMHGSYSIKYVLPALFPNNDDLNYKKLDQIHNGSEAMSAFANLKDKSLKDQENIRHNLLKYCELDTYAMVKIWEKLEEVCAER